MQEPPRGTAPKGESEKIDILIVDDQTQRLLSYEAVLAPLGERVLRARTGAAALEVLLKREIAVILLDVVMPEMDGFELARIIRSHPRFERTPIIFVTAIGTSEMEQVRAYELGAVDYVHVPVVPEVLRTKVAVFVELYRTTRALRILNRELERRVEERTAELERATMVLRERAERLAEADRLKDEFLAMLAHELRNPLAPLLSSLQILRLPQADAPTRERARELAERQVRHLTRILDDLLDISRITRGKIALQAEPVEVREVVERVVQATGDLIRNRGHDLSVTLPAEPVWFDADPTRLEQILVNLLSNAAKFTSPGGRIEFAAEHADGRIVLRVRDSGMGISAEMLPIIFEPFTQAGRSIDRPEGGLGIGLTLVQRLVEMHGGTVTAASGGLGCGSEFVVSLPIGRATGAPVPESEAPSSSYGPSKRVLLVEDNADVASGLALLLTSLGHRVVTAPDGVAAIRAASESRPDLVLMDIGLPGLDGYEVARRLRSDRSLDAVPLVALTGYAAEADRQRSMRAGFNHHLAKPVSLDILQQLLAKLASPVES